MAKQTITVTFDTETQEIEAGFNNGEFKQWLFVAAVLDMAAEKCRFMERYLATKNAQAQEAQQQQLRQIGEQIRQNPRGNGLIT